MAEQNQEVLIKLNEFVEKVDHMKKQEKMDLSSDQDLSIAIMNLVSIEEHFFFTGAKLGKPEYYDLIQEARKMRGDLLKKIIKELSENPDVTVLVSSHDLVHTVEVCERIVALNKGEVVKDIVTSEETLKELEAFFAV